MDICKDTKKETFTLIVSRDELRVIRDALGTCEINKSREREMWTQIATEMELIR